MQDVCATLPTGAHHESRMQSTPSPPPPATAATRIFRLNEIIPGGPNQKASLESSIDYDICLPHNTLYIVRAFFGSGLVCFFSHTMSLVMNGWLLPVCCHPISSPTPTHPTTTTTTTTTKHPHTQMLPGCQEQFKHSVPARSDKQHFPVHPLAGEERISLTYRCNRRHPVPVCGGHGTPAILHVLHRGAFDRYVWSVRAYMRACVRACIQNAWS
jgi:hypothetical protein